MGTKGCQRDGWRRNPSRLGRALLSRYSTAMMAHCNAKWANLSRRFGSFACSEMRRLSRANHSNRPGMSWSYDT